MPRPQPPTGVWSLTANETHFQRVHDLPTLLHGLHVSHVFRGDLLTFYDATKLTPHPQLLPLNPNEEDPRSTGIDSTAHNSVPTPLTYDLADIDHVRVKNWKLDAGSFHGLCFALQHSSTVASITFFNANLDPQQVTMLCQLIPQTQVTRVSIDWNPVGGSIGCDGTVGHGRTNEASSSDRHPPSERNVNVTEAQPTKALAPTLPIDAFPILLTTPSRVTTLSLRANGLTATHAQALALALRDNKTLEVLNLFGNPIGDAGAQAIAYALPFTKTLKSLSLGNTGLHGKTAVLLVAVLMPRYVAPPALLAELEEAEPRIQVELDQAKKAKKKTDRASVIQQLGLPMLENVDGVQYARGNESVEDLILSGNEGIKESDVQAMSDALSKQSGTQRRLQRIKLQRIQALYHLAPRSYNGGIESSAATGGTETTGLRRLPVSDILFF